MSTKATYFNERVRRHPEPPEAEKGLGIREAGRFPLGEILRCALRQAQDRLRMTA